MSSDAPHLTLWEHLEVLRRVLVKSTGALAVCTVLGLFYTSLVFRLLLFPVRDHLDPRLRHHYFSGESSASPAGADLSTDTATEQKISRLLNQLHNPDLSIEKKIELQSQCLSVLLEEKKLAMGQTGTNARIRIIYASPVEPFMIRLKAGFLGGAGIAFPFICYFLWGFASPAIRRDERRLVLRSTTAGTLLFFAGICFGYCFLPLGIPALLKFSAPGVEHIWTLRSYIGFSSRLLLAFGLAFEMPLVFGVLAHFRLLTSKRLIEGRVYAVIIIFVLAAWLTPPDILSQIALALPMLGLYELSVLTVKKVNKKERISDGPQAV